MERLDKKLKVYGESDFYGFHMPGHKRNEELFGNLLPYGIDITEIDGFDDLHHCEGVLMEAQHRAAKMFGAESTYFLVNGSTVGILAAICACTNKCDKILMARNCHKAVYNGVFLNELQPIYVYPEVENEYLIQGEIRPERIEELLKCEIHIKAVVITSPTYDGVISDVAEIAKICHKHSVILIVDEAHGAHLGMHPDCMKNSNVLGADVVIHSVHKTLPSLTQTALLHVNGNLVNQDAVKKYLKILQSSSPSYVLLASIDRCIHLLEKHRDELFQNYVNRLQKAKEVLRGLKKLRLIEMESMEPSKLLISTKYAKITAKELYERLLNEYHIQMEMVAPSYVLAMTSVGDSEEGFARLSEALLEIDEKIQEKTSNSIDVNDIMLERLPLPQMAKTESERAGKFYYLYPPGIPFVTPEEKITDEIQACMNRYKKKGFEVRIG